MLATKTPRQVNYDIPEVGADANGAAATATEDLGRETEVRFCRQPGGLEHRRS